MTGPVMSAAASAMAAARRAGVEEVRRIRDRTQQENVVAGRVEIGDDIRGDLGRRSGAEGKCVVPGAAGEGVDAEVAENQIVPTVTGDLIVPLAAAKEIIS